MKRLFLLSALLLSLLPYAAADEGMWLFEAPPTKKIQAKYGFAPTQAWLDHVRLSSVRFPNGTGSFVSPDGLVFTNHHIGANCLHNLSTGGKDYLKTGFYAKTQVEEAKCPDVELNVLMSTEDVTDKVNAAAKPGMSDAEKGTAQRAGMSQIEKDCTTETGLRCDVVTLYAGSVFHLYRYKKYTDVRLVFAPEFKMAFFGGDPDNFEYPRYDLDITFFRIYENDKPVHLDNYLKWSPTGVRENDLVFVSGNPGSTGRLLTMAQLEYLKDFGYPWSLKILKMRDDALQEFSAGSAQKALEAQEDIFGIENSLKAYKGYNVGLTDPRNLAKKRAEEEQLRKTVESDAKLKTEIGDPWSAIAKSQQVLREIFYPLTYIERLSMLRADEAQYARTLVRVNVEKQKPNGERLREYRDSALPSLEQGLFSTAPVYKDLEIAVMTESLAEAQQYIPNDPTLQKVLAGRSPAEAAAFYINGTKLDDPAVRKQLYEGGVKAVEASTDPLIVIMRDIDSEARKLRTRYDDEVDSVVRANGAKVAKAHFFKTGFNEPPDATFTLRLSYGAVKGYTEQGKPVRYFTTMGGAFEHAAAHGNKDPYELPESWMKAKSKIKLDTPLNYVHTCDIIGGNSGSPTLNKNAEVVGIIFDGNIESLPWNFVYSDTQGRAISVDSRGIMEALRDVYGANELADELTRAAGASTHSAARPIGPKKPAEKKK
jgi:hypothetical protein